MIKISKKRSPKNKKVKTLIYNDLSNYYWVGNITKDERNQYLNFVSGFKCGDHNFVVGDKKVNLLREKFLKDRKMKKVQSIFYRTKKTKKTKPINKSYSGKQAFSSIPLGKIPKILC